MKWKLKREEDNRSRRMCLSWGLDLIPCVVKNHWEILIRELIWSKLSFRNIIWVQYKKGIEGEWIPWGQDINFKIISVSQMRKMQELMGWRRCQERCTCFVFQEQSLSSPLPVLALHSITSCVCVSQHFTVQRLQEGMVGMFCSTSCPMEWTISNTINLFWEAISKGMDRLSTECLWSYSILTILLSLKDTVSIFQSESQTLCNNHIPNLFCLKWTPLFPAGIGTWIAQNYILSYSSFSAASLIPTYLQRFLILLGTV